MTDPFLRAGKDLNVGTFQDTKLEDSLVIFGHGTDYINDSDTTKTAEAGVVSSIIDKFLAATSEGGGTDTAVFIGATPSQADGVAQSKLRFGSNPGTADAIGIVARYTDIDNYYLGEFVGNGGGNVVIRLRKKTASSFSTLATSAPFAMPAGETDLQLEVSGGAALTLTSLTSSVTINATDPDHSTGQWGTRLAVSALQAAVEYLTLSTPALTATYHSEIFDSGLTDHKWNHLAWRVDNTLGGTISALARSSNVLANLQNDVTPFSGPFTDPSGLANNVFMLGRYSQVRFDFERTLSNPDKPKLFGFDFAPTAPETTPPTFGGLTTAVENTGTKAGSVALSWSAGSDVANPPVTYRIYVRQGNDPDVFGVASPYFLAEVDGTLFDVWTEADGQVRLRANKTYHFIVRAADKVGNEDTNTTAKTVTITLITETFTSNDTDDVFPFTPHYSFVEGIFQRTLISQFESGFEHRRGMWSRARRTFTVRLSPLTLEDDGACAGARTLWEFFEDHGHALKTFLFLSLNDPTIVGESIDPAGTTQSYSYVTDNPNVVPSSLTITAPTGNLTDNGLGGITGSNLLAGSITYRTGLIEIDFASAPGGTITAGYRFYRRVRFDEEPLSSENFSFKLYGAGIRMLEVFL